MKNIFNVFYRQHGCLRIQDLYTLKSTVLLDLPRDSIFHYLDHETDPVLDIGDVPYIKSEKKKHPIDFPSDLVSFDGNPRARAFNIVPLVRTFIKTHNTYQYLLDPVSKVSDPLNTIIYNYNLIKSRYKYVVTPLTIYYEWLNLEKARLNNIIKINSNHPNKNHFIEISLPKVIKSITVYNTLSKFTKVNIQYLKYLSTPEDLFFMELFKWLDPVERSKSIFGVLPQSSLKTINLIIKLNNKESAIINLGYLNSWLKGQPNQTMFDHVAVFDYLQIQRFLVKFGLLSTTISNDVKIEEELKEPVKNSAAEYDKDTAEALDEDDSDGESEHERSDFLPSSLPTEQKKNLNNPNDFIEEDKFSGIDNEINKINQELSDLDTEAPKEIQEEEDIYGEEKDTTLPLDKIKANLNETNDAAEDLKLLLDNMAETGNLSAAEYKKLTKEINTFDQQKDPYGSSLNVKQKSIITKEDLEINNKDSEIVATDLVVDKSMLKSSLQNYDKKYIDIVLQKDVVSVVRSFHRAGVFIKSHSIEKDVTAIGETEIHKLELKPIKGNASTIYIRVPKIKNDGTFTVNGSKYSMRKQRVDLPIRKISPTEVALTSYYGKTFVDRSSKKSNSTPEWLVKKINESLLDENGKVKEIVPGDTYNNKLKLSYLYSALSKTFKVIKTDELTLSFDYNDKMTLGGNKDIELLKNKGHTISGYDKQGNPIVIKDDVYSVYKNNSLILLGDIFEILGLEKKACPVDFSEVRVFTKTVPVGLLLGYYIGLNNLLKLLEVNYSIEDSATRLTKDDENLFVVKFYDKKIVLSRKDKVAALIMGGYLEYEKQIKKYNIENFYANENGIVNKDAFFNLFDSKQLSSIYVKEMDNLERLFIDPITEGLLKDMGMPLTYRGLLLKATEMLTTYNHPDSQDMSEMRIRGYERIAGAMYKEIALAIRQFNNKNISGRSKIEMSPFQVWGSIMKDPAIKLVEETNPIANLKETEIVTYVGEGGRSKDSITIKSRATHINDIGVISEATVDSSDAGTNTYLSANPNFSDLRGRTLDKKNYDMANIWSTSVLLSPGADCDDGKRNNFISIQHSHTIATEGYRQPYIRTGYDYIVGNRTSATFAYFAKKDGIVTSKTEKGIMLKYNDGEVVGVELGRIFGKAEGSFYPHNIVGVLDANNKFKKGDPIAYNDGFFEPDILDPKKIIMKISTTAKVALYEAKQTLEDSSAVSPELSNRLTSKTTKVKSITVDFNQNIVDPVTIGQEVKADDVLMLIEDEITSSGHFDSEALKELKKLSNQAPKAKYEGVIEKIEVLYNGDKSDMTPSLRKLADASDKVLAFSRKSINEPVVTGSVTSEYRVSGTPLELDRAEIKIYLTIRTDVGVGDKVVFANQLKSVNGETMNYKMYTEDGIKIEACFGYISILNRIVTSPILQGTTITLLKTIAQKAVKMYKG